MARSVPLSPPRPVLTRCGSREGRCRQATATATATATQRRRKARSRCSDGGVAMTPENVAGVTPSERRRLIVKRAVQLVVQNALFVMILLLSRSRGWWNAWLSPGCSSCSWRRTPPTSCLAIRRSLPNVDGPTREPSPSTVFCSWVLDLLSRAADPRGTRRRRFGWTALGWPWALLGGLLLAVSTIPIARAMAVNRNLETTVRIQPNAGTRSSRGGLSVVRHPMYLCMFAQLPATALCSDRDGRWSPRWCARILVIRTALRIAPCFDTCRAMPSTRGVRGIAWCRESGDRPQRWAAPAPGQIPNRP